MGASGWTHLDVKKVKKTTSKALLALLSSKREVWIPLSVIADADNYEEGDENATISVKDWFCEKEGLE